MHQSHNHMDSLCYAAMACGLTIGVDHTLLAGLYLIVALLHWASSGK
jgi:hypothetical protein